MKKILTLIILSLFIITFLTSCREDEKSKNYVNIEMNAQIPINRFGNFISLGSLGCGEELVYDNMTGIVYIRQYTYNSNYIYTPYYAPNGLPYRYDPITNTFEEINNQLNDDLDIDKVDEK